MQPLVASRGGAPGPLSPIRNRSTSFRFLTHPSRGTARDERDARATGPGSARVCKIAPERTLGAHRRGADGLARRTAVRDEATPNVSNQLELRRASSAFTYTHCRSVP